MTEETVDLDDVLLGDEADVLTVYVAVKIRQSNVADPDWSTVYARMRENAMNTLDYFTEQAIADKGWEKAK